MNEAPLCGEKEAALKPEEAEPTSNLNRCSVLSRFVHNRLPKSPFLNRHLTPRAAFVNNIADTLFLQPAKREAEGYTHISIFNGHNIYDTLRLGPATESTTSTSTTQTSCLSRCRY